MRDIDYLALDGHSLRTFLVVLEEGSVSLAAGRLGVTQSAVSHTLVKVRTAVGDPLFVRSGRGITPTKLAMELQQPVRQLLDSLKSITEQRVFDPKIGKMEFTVAANDHQRNLLFPALLRKVRVENIDLRLHFVPSGVPALALLNEERCQLIVTPFPPEGPDIIQQRLFSDQPMCFFDGSVRPAPDTWDEIIERDQIVVRFSDNRTALVMLPKEYVARLRKPFCTVSNFSALADLIENTDAIAIAASLMKHSILSRLDLAPLPFHTDPLAMYMVWHRRDHADPAHRWLRKQIKAAVSRLGVSATN